jgi:N-acetylglucosaminyldiphosphoundecaprenol N-acetyl-beta-D-mannosaminyltransferase
MRDPGMQDMGSSMAAALAPTDFQRRAYCILGLPFDAMTTAQGEAALRAAVRARQRCFFSTPNLNFLISSLSDPAFRDSVIRSDLSFADGMPVVWIARVLGIPVHARVAGSTLFEGLRKQNGLPLRVFFFGGPDGVARRAGDVLNQEAGGMLCVGARSPGFGSIADMSTPALIDEINHARADFLVVALGAKRGQTWIEHNLARLNVPVISHLGAVVNFVAGTITRAPPKVGGLGLEWLWRIKEEPALWRRYFGDGRAFLKLLLTHVLPGALAARRFRASLGRQPAGVIAVSHESNRCRIALSGAWHERNLQPLRDALAAATQSACHVTLDLKQVDGMDGAAVGMLVLLYGHQSKNRLGFVIAALSPALHRTLRLSCADYLLRPMIAEGERPQADLVQSINS